MTDRKLYLGPLTDNRRWDAVDLRPDDVIVVTPPKCGTTWTLAMVYLLLNGWDAKFDDLSRIAPWIDHLGAKASPTGSGRRLPLSKSPSASTRAFLQSIIPAPVVFLNLFTSAAVILTISN